MPTQIYPNSFGGSSSSVEVNGALVPGTPDFNSLLPVPTVGFTSVTWAFDPSGNILASMYVSTNASVTVNSVPYSDDFGVSVNSVDQDFLVNSSVPQNASPAYANGTPVI